MNLNGDKRLVMWVDLGIQRECKLKEFKMLELIIKNKMIESYKQRLAKGPSKLYVDEIGDKTFRVSISTCLLKEEIAYLDSGSIDTGDVKGFRRRLFLEDVLPLVNQLPHFYKKTVLHGHNSEMAIVDNIKINEEYVLKGLEDE